MKTILENVRKKCPLIHNITNYVTANDCANVLLACGASPIMADDEGEVEEITSICAGLNINIGTLNQRTIPSMHKAGRRANELGHPVVLDPVGVGASKLRTKTALDLIEDVRFTVIRGNMSEIKTLARRMNAAESLYGHSAQQDTSLTDRASVERAGITRGVDADVSDKITRENLQQVISFAKEFAGRTGAIIAITGAIDIVADKEYAYCIFNGHPMMSSVTGTGCQLSALTAAYVTANPDKPLEAAAAAVCLMGVCGEKAYTRLGKEDGNASYRNYIIDAIYNMTGEELEERARIEKY